LSRHRIAWREPEPEIAALPRLGEKYPLAHLGEALAEGVVVGHECEEMSPFRFSAQEIDALLAYFASVQRK